MVDEIDEDRKRLHFLICKWKLASAIMTAVGEMCPSETRVDRFLT